MTRWVGLGPWKFSTLTLWLRRAMDALPSQAYSIVIAAASCLLSPRRLSAYER